jgi:hypothetical protein
LEQYLLTLISIPSKEKLLYETLRRKDLAMVYSMVYSMRFRRDLHPAFLFAKQRGSSYFKAICHCPPGKAGYLSKGCGKFFSYV